MRSGSSRMLRISRLCGEDENRRRPIHSTFGDLNGSGDRTTDQHVLGTISYSLTKNPNE
jgi:hypothetical protein